MSGLLLYNLKNRAGKAKWIGLIVVQMQSVQLIEITDFPDHFVDIGWADPDAIANENRRCRKAWHKLDVDLSGSMIEEDIVALAKSAEVLHEIAGRNLDEVRDGIDSGCGLNLSGNDVQFPEADAGMIGYGEIDAMAAAD